MSIKSIEIFYSGPSWRRQDPSKAADFNTLAANETRCENETIAPHRVALLLAGEPHKSQCGELRHVLNMLPGVSQRPHDTVSIFECDLSQEQLACLANNVKETTF